MPIAQEDWETGYAFDQHPDPDEGDDLLPPLRLNVPAEESDFSGSEIDWSELQEPANGDSSSLFTREGVDREEDIQAPRSDPWFYAKLAAQSRKSRHAQPHVAPLHVSRPEVPCKPLEDAFQRQRERQAELFLTPRQKGCKPEAVLASENAASGAVSNHDLKSWPALTRLHTGAQSSAPAELPIRPAPCDSPTPLTPMLACDSSPYDSEPGNWSSSPLPTPHLPTPKSTHQPFSSTYRLTLYEPPPRDALGKSTAPIVYGAGAMAPKTPARRMHRPFRSPSSIKVAPLITRGNPDESPFGRFAFSPTFNRKRGIVLAPDIGCEQAEEASQVE